MESDDRNKSKTFTYTHTQRTGEAHTEVSISHLPVGTTPSAMNKVSKQMSGEHQIDGLASSAAQTQAQIY